ncbi:MAG: hypothetical protein AcusKO_10420 [Acuticoccus sp.]
MATDTIEGGTGIDTAVYAGNLADFAIDVIAGTITDTNAGDVRRGGRHHLGIEVAQFADGTVLFAARTATPDHPGGGGGGERRDTI